MKTARKTVMKIAAASMAIVVAVTFVPMLPGVSAQADAADGAAKAAETDMTSASEVTAESPSEFTFETDFDALTQKWRRYPKISFGQDGKEWIVCGKQNNELVLICNPADSYGQTTFADDTGSYEYSYETSQLDKTLQQMTAKGSNAFSQSEISLMKDVSVTLVGDYNNFKGSMYQITRKLYAPYPNEGTVKIGCGIKDSMGDIQISLSDSQFKGASFWTRAVNRSDVYKYENGSQTTTDASGTSNILPAMHIDLASDTAKALFVSAAEPAKEDAKLISTAATPSPQDTTLTVRYDGADKVSYKAEYNSDSITVTSTKAAHDEYLYVQWSENRVNKIKSVKLKDCPTAWGGQSKYTAEEIGGSGFSLTDGVKIWIEKKVDNLTYADMGTRVKENGPEVPADLKMTRSANGESNGALSGLDPGVEYEYCLYNKAKATQDWTKLAKGSTEIKNLCSGNYCIRAAETEECSTGPERMYRVKDIYDVTIDSGSNAVLVNDKDISAYSAFGSLSIDPGYSKDEVFNTLSNIKDVFDAKTVSGLVEKYAGGKTREEFNTYKTVERLGKVTESLTSLSAKTDGTTKEILGDIDSSELKKEWNDAEKSFSKFQESYYDDFTDSRLEDIKEFYSGGMTDKDITADIDSSFLYFYSDGNKSQLTGERDNMANGTKLYKDFTEFGDGILNAAANGKNRKDIFALCEGAYSYLHNFNSETFSDRGELYKKIFYFYEKGYSAVASSLAYNISNHKEQLNRITDLRTAAVRADTMEDSETIQNAIRTVAKETAKVYGYDTGSFGWNELEKLHTDQIEQEKESLENLNAQYESIKAAYEKAENNLQAEKEKYESDRIITCYRNQAKYNADLEILSVNDPYVEEMKSTKVKNFLTYEEEHLGTEIAYYFDGLANKYAASDRTSAKAEELVNDLKSFTEWSRDRGMTLKDQMGRVFSFYDTDTQKRMEFSKFSSYKKSANTLGFYVNGTQKFELEEHFFKSNYGHFYRNVSYYKEGEIGTFCSAHKSWSSHGTLLGTLAGKDYKEIVKDNDVKSDTYVIHLNRVTETSGRGGDDELLMATGSAKKSTNTIKWNAVDGAEGYDVYYARTGKSFKKFKTVKALKYTKKNVNSKRVYKYKVKAFCYADGKKQYMQTAPAIYVAGSGSKYSNAKKVVANPDEINLKAGQTGTIKAKITKKSSSKPVLWKHYVKSKLRYFSTDKSVATVNSKGRIKATGEGTAYVYAYAASGAFAKVTVTVEAE